MAGSPKFFPLRAAPHKCKEHTLLFFAVTPLSESGSLNRETSTGALILFTRLKTSIYQSEYLRLRISLFPLLRSIFVCFSQR